MALQRYLHVGGDSGTRTRNLGDANAALSRLSYIPTLASAVPIIDTRQKPVKESALDRTLPPSWGALRSDRHEAIHGLHLNVAGLWVHT